MKQGLSEKSLLWLKRSLVVLGGVSLLGSGLGELTATATTQTLEIDATPSVSAPIEPVTPVEAPKPAIQTEVAPKAPTRQPVVSKEPVKPVYKVSPKSLTPPTARPKLSAPQISVPQPKTTVSAPSPQVQFESKNRYIDPTNYNVTQPTVVVTERRTGCQTVAQAGNLSGNCGVSLKKPVSLAQAKPESPKRSRVHAPVVRESSIRQNYQSQLMGQNRQSVVVKTAVRSTAPQSQPQTVSRPMSRPVTISSQSVVSLQPIQRQGLSISLEPVAPYNRATSLYSQPTTSIPQRTTDLIFPLPIIGEITSAFGWRQHPIHRTQRFHDGTDIGAAMGTPVLAAYQGQVATADWAGGYGLMVTIRHLDGTQESRYAHLSEIFVQPGQWVEQGMVIGRVGSTGASTGPHLHFEWRHQTEEGWVAVDAGLHLEYALDNLINSFNYARMVEKPES